MRSVLPDPEGAFRWTHADGHPALACAALPARHFFTTREWALGSASEPAAWAEVAAAAGVAPERLVRAHQVHGAAALIVRKGVGAGTAHLAGQAPHVRADVLASDDGAVALGVQTADCVPLLLADARIGAVAAVHAGWRGIAARAPAAGLDAMARAFGTRAADVVAAIGPAVGACCYEVGGEVRDELAAAGFAAGMLDRWFSRTALVLPRNPPVPGVHVGGRAGHWFFDAWTAVRDALEECGVAADRIHAAALCTASHAHLFCSYRRDGRNAGRMAAIIRSGRG